MREALNNNPEVQAAVLGVLLVGAAIFLLSRGGGDGEEAGATEATVSVSGTEASGTATGATPGEAVEGAVEAAAEDAGGAAAADIAGLLAATDAPPLPQPVLDAYAANRTIVLVIVQNGGIDDHLVRIATEGLAGFRNASVFVVPAGQISRYAAITEGVGVERVPALVVVTPRRVEQTVPTASVSYGFQSPQSIAQAVIDAGYEGPTLGYHP